MYPYVWAWKPSPMRPIDRKGQPCRVLARGKKNTILVEFRDGYKVTTSRFAIRKETPDVNPQEAPQG